MIIINSKELNVAIAEVAKRNTTAVETLAMSYEKSVEAYSNLVNAAISPDFNTVELGENFFILQEIRANLFLMNRLGALNGEYRKISGKSFIEGFVSYKKLYDRFCSMNIRDLDDEEIKALIYEARSSKDLPVVRKAVVQASSVLINLAATAI